MTICLIAKKTDKYVTKGKKYYVIAMEEDSVEFINDNGVTDSVNLDNPDFNMIVSNGGISEYIDKKSLISELKSTNIPDEIKNQVLQVIENQSSFDL